MSIKRAIYRGAAGALKRVLPLLFVDMEPTDRDHFAEDLGRLARRRVRPTVDDFAAAIDQIIDRLPL